MADSIHSIYCTSNLPVYKVNESLTVLIAVAGGKGILTTEDKVYELIEGSAILLPAHCEATLVANLQHPLHFYKLVINTREYSGKVTEGSMIRKSEAVSNTTVHFIPYQPKIVAGVVELYLHRLPERETRHVHNQIVFHQIILHLLDEQETKYTASEQPSMERSITYLENNYSDKITRDGLAEIAGVTGSHYSILFKQTTGYPLSEYLSKLRVNRAKELLISGSGTLREIALKVGYKDEFYLSRRFKQGTGVAPSSYARGLFQKVAVFLSPYASHLLLLGLEPTVIISDSSEYVNTTEIQSPQSINFINTTSSVDQVKSILIENNIELLFAASKHLNEYGLHAEHLRVAAPIVDIPWMELGWKEHLFHMAHVIQKREQAEKWLADFEKEEQAARYLVQQTSVANEILTIFVIKPEELLIYGVRNVGYVMFQSLGLQPHDRIKQLIEKHGDQFHSIPIEMSELADYAGDRLLVIVFPDVKGSTAHSDPIFKSTYWLNLPAVQLNSVHQLEVDDWIPYNPISIRLQLQRAVDLFTGIQ
ncbi:helix-turn-helix domain-containing protein [Paenibacillus sp. GSMTC-2017]|nr:helix-turn-helix domain-containing protein [Paenibacillus sp. GSMTC-2017]MBH5318443.1 helix-turn-helix domain-containing protein [Paenibacillus sp. GSMTC-2017]